MQVSGSTTSSLMLAQSAASILSDGVSSSDSSALFGAANSSAAGSYGASDLFGLSTTSTAVSLAADTFASVLSSAGDSTVQLAIQQATSRVMAKAYEKMQNAQSSANAAKAAFP